jgi:hypothetical protein
VDTLEMHEDLAPMAVRPHQPLFGGFVYTSGALAFGVAVIILAMFFDVNLFEIDVDSLRRLGIEHNETGEILLAFLLVIPGFLMDRRARRREYDAMIRAEQLRVVAVTMRAVQDIVNNNLKQLQLLRIVADGQVPADVLQSFDQTILDTSAQLTALGNSAVFTERVIATGQAQLIPDGSQ